MKKRLSITLIFTFGNVLKNGCWILQINLLDTKISDKDTDNDLIVFEQTGLSQKARPQLHIHPNQDEWFILLKGSIYFKLMNINII